MVSLLYGTLRKHNASSTTDNGVKGSTIVEPLHTKEINVTLGNPLNFPFSLVSSLDVERCFQDSKRAEKNIA